MKRPQFVIIALSLLIIALSLIRIFVIIDLSITSIEQARVENELRNLRTQNILIREKLLNTKAYINLSETAQQQGFTQQRRTIYIHAN